MVTKHTVRVLPFDWFHCIGSAAIQRTLCHRSTSGQQTKRFTIGRTVWSIAKIPWRMSFWNNSCIHSLTNRNDSIFQSSFQNVELTHKVPWLVVVYKFLKQWAETSGKKVPTNYKEKCELKRLIQSAITKEEENYEEAVKAINSCFGGGKPNSRLQEILNDPACNQLTKDVSSIASKQQP